MSKEPGGLHRRRPAARLLVCDFSDVTGPCFLGQTVKTKEPDTPAEPGPVSDAEPAPESELQLEPQGDSAPATSAVPADAPADPHGAPEDVAATPTSQVTPASPSR